MRMENYWHKLLFWQRTDIYSKTDVVKAYIIAATIGTESDIESPLRTDCVHILIAQKYNTKPHW